MPTKIDRIITPDVSKQEGNMKVTILYPGKYLDPDRLPLWKAKYRELGEVVEFPLDYAEDIIASGLAEELGPDLAAIEVEAEDAPIDATNGAMARAEELGIDLATVVGTGTGGRITARDVARLE